MAPKITTQKLINVNGNIVIPLPGRSDLGVVSTVGSSRGSGVAVGSSKIVGVNWADGVASPKTDSPLFAILNLLIMVFPLLNSSLAFIVNSYFPATKSY